MDSCTGPDGLKAVAETAVLNNNYLYSKIKEIKGVDVPYAEGGRLEQVRYSWEPLYQDTGITTEDISRRMADFAHQYWTSHHPYVVPQPFTLEPTESYSKEDLDEYIRSLTHISNEAYTSPEVIQSAPHCSSIHKITTDKYFEDPEHWAITWRAYLKKYKNTKEKQT